MTLLLGTSLSGLKPDVIDTETSNESRASVPVLSEKLREAKQNCIDAILGFDHAWSGDPAVGDLHLELHPCCGKVERITLHPAHDLAALKYVRSRYEVSVLAGAVCYDCANFRGGRLSYLEIGADIGRADRWYIEQSINKDKPWFA